MGIQSTYERTLDAVRRVNDWPRIEKVMKTLRDYQSVHLHLDLIVGLPYETMEHLQQSFNEIYALKPHVLQIGFLKLLKGSGIRNRFAKDYRFDPDGPYEILETAWLSFGQVRRMKRFEDVFERVYNSNKFTDFLNYVVPFYESPFVFYDEVTLFIDKVHGDEGLLSDRTLIDLLYEFVRDSKKIEKKKVETPAELKGIVRCNNPKCITNNEPMQTVFHVVDKVSRTLKCHYCDMEQAIDKAQLV